jgi:hypothetical protein
MVPRNEPRYILIFSQDVSASEYTPGSPTGPLWREISVYRTYFISVDMSLYLRDPKKVRPFMFPKSGAPMETDAHSKALLNISFGVSSKGALPPGTPHGVPLEADASSVGLRETAELSDYSFLGLSILYKCILFIYLLHAPSQQ